MMLRLAILIAATSLLAGAAPSGLQLFERAGGAGSLPVDPAACIVAYPVSTPNATEADYQSFTVNLPSSNQVYAWDLPESSANYTTLWEQCLEQCNFLRDGAVRAGKPELSCRSAYLANDVPNQQGYVPAGTFLGWGCRMYNVSINDTVIATVDDGTHTQAIAANLTCALPAMPPMCRG